MDMEIIKSWKDNLFIYKENLSVYYIISIVMSFLSVFMTWWIHKYYTRTSGIGNENITNPISQTMDDINKPKKEPTEINELLDAELTPSSEILKQAKLVKQSDHSSRSIPLTLTEEQLREEKEVESQQLAEILKVLQEQHDKFNVSSMEELQDQMKLYR